MKNISIKKIKKDIMNLIIDFKYNNERKKKLKITKNTKIIIGLAFIKKIVYF